LKTAYLKKQWRCHFLFTTFLDLPYFISGHLSRREKTQSSLTHQKKHAFFYVAEIKWLA